MDKMHRLKKSRCCCSFLLLGLILTVLLFLFPFSALADGETKPERVEKDTVQEKTTAKPVPPEKITKMRSPAPEKRDPTKVLPEIESQLEEVEPPEIRITGVIEARGRKAAMAELNLEDFEGMVMLEPGMTVSIPKPNRGQSDSKRWMTFFQVSDIKTNGVLLVLENGERIWVPVMGEKD